MFDIGWSELVLIGVVALIVVGPKDLPRMFHALGRMTAKARNMAREFQRAMDDAAKSSGLDEVRKDVADIRAATSTSGLGINALENAASKFEKWDPKSVIKPTTGAATAELAEKRAADQAAARQKTLELQAQRTAAASQTFAEKAKEVAPEPAPVAADPAPAAAAAASPAPEPVAEPVAEAAAKPARKPPTRRKKSDDA